MGHWTEDYFVDQPELLGNAMEAKGEAADEEVESILAALDREFDHRPETVLDAACGIGRHAVAFAERGHEVTGFDISGAYVDRARERAEEARVADRVEFFEGDLREVGGFDGEYDLVACLWNSFGYYDDGTNAEVLSGFGSRLGPGGALVLEVPCRDGILWDFPGDSVTETDDRLAVARWSYDVPTSRYEVEHTVFEREGGDLRHLGTGTFRVRAYSPPEIASVCRDAGFEDVRMLGGYDGRDPSLEDDRLVVLAR
ncbi:class I SAM-dependent methyltransferase [Halobacteriales archaeon QS_8_69_26]|nr:MAG: class I SAM-dependent methyltransferase [Halobacteriales archaeon QS_8_69_26]